MGVGLQGSIPRAALAHGEVDQGLWADRETEDGRGDSHGFHREAEEVMLG